VVAPMMEAADNGAVALVRDSQGKKPVRTPVLETAQLALDALDENRTAANGGPEPVAFMRGVTRHAQEGPDMRKSRLLRGKCLGVIGRRRPACRQDADDRLAYGVRHFLCDHRSDPALRSTPIRSARRRPKSAVLRRFSCHRLPGHPAEK